MDEDSISIVTGDNDVDYANSTLTFPQKLFILMEKETGEIIQWATHGLCFRISDEDTFVDVLMPKYFKRKSTSFSLTTLLISHSHAVSLHPRNQTHQLPAPTESLRLPPPNQR